MSPIIFTILVVGVAWIAIFISAPKETVQDEFYRQEVATEVFQKSLHGITQDGCTAISSMPKLDVLVVGNSHVYSGIDSYELAKAFPGQRTAVCSYGIFHLSNFDPLFSYLDSLEMKPRRIIWVIDFYMISESLIEDDAEQARKIFFDEATRQITYKKWNENIELGKPILGRTAEEYDDWFNKHSQAIANLDPNKVAAVVRANTLRDERETLEFFLKLKPNPNLARDLEGLCKSFKLRSIKADAIVSPVPPSEFWEPGYPDDLEERFSSLSAFFEESMPCLNNVVQLSLTDLNLDVRHFLNIIFEDFFDYKIFDDPETFQAKYEALNETQQRRFYDAHHLNPLGAKVFTRQVMEKLN